MDDSTICLWDKECPLASTCKRALTPLDSHRQEFFAPEHPGEDCEHYLEAEEE